MEENVELRELTEEDRDLISWFSGTSADPNKNRFIFGRESLDKLSELKKARDWFLWLRQRFNALEQESQAFVAHELGRPQPEGGERSIPKWRIRIRLTSLSHSIRQKPLNEWNQRVPHIQLNRSNKKELLVDLTLPKAIPLNGLWWAGWGQARALTAALNIGSMGFFWFSIPEALSRYYDSIEDLENKQQVVLERVPKLSIDFGHSTLDSADLQRMSLVRGFMPGPNDSTMHATYNHYLTGLGFMGKNDVHMQVEPNAFIEFLRAFKSALRLYGDWDLGTDFRAATRRVLEAGVPSDNLGGNTTLELIELGQTMETSRVLTKHITLTEVIGIKIVCDVYFQIVLNRKAQERVRKERGAS
jgi:hypothetical protein